MFSEKHVIIFSGISGVLSLITCVAIAITWTYWSSTLNNCTGGNCECVLFGEVRGSSFIGGKPISCRTVTYSTLFFTIVSFAVAAYYLIKIRTTQPKNTFNRATQSEENIPSTRFSACRNKAQFPLLFKLIAGSITFLLFVEAITLSEGYGQTCAEYRKLVHLILKANGDLSNLVMDRFSCGTIYDFLDYLQPDPVYNRNVYLPQYYYHPRTTKINSGAILLTSVVFSWLNVGIWSIITVFVGFCR